MSKEPKMCEVSADYSKDEFKQLYFYCRHCGKEMEYDEKRICGATPSKPEWEEEFKKWYNEPYPAAWKAHKVIEKVEELLSSHRRSLAEEVGKLRKEKHDNIPSAIDWGANECDGSETLRDCSAQDAECYNAALKDVLTLINRDIP